MEWENSTIWMEIFLKENGLMIKQMVMEFTTIQMEILIKDIGKMINSMDLELKHV